MYVCMERGTVEFKLHPVNTSTGCRHVHNFSFEGGNMTCPESAPVLVALQTLAPSPE